MRPSPEQRAAEKLGWRPTRYGTYVLATHTNGGNYEARFAYFERYDFAGDPVLFDHRGTFWFGEGVTKLYPVFPEKRPATPPPAASLVPPEPAIPKATRLPRDRGCEPERHPPATVRVKR